MNLRARPLDDEPEPLARLHRLGIGLLTYVPRAGSCRVDFHRDAPLLSAGANRRLGGRAATDVPGTYGEDPEGHPSSPTRSMARAM